MRKNKYYLSVHPVTSKVLGDLMDTVDRDPEDPNDAPPNPDPDGVLVEITERDYGRWKSGERPDVASGPDGREVRGWKVKEELLSVQAVVTGEAVDDGSSPVHVVLSGGPAGGVYSLMGSRAFACSKPVQGQFDEAGGAEFDIKVWGQGGLAVTVVVEDEGYQPSSFSVTPGSYGSGG